MEVDEKEDYSEVMNDPAFLQSVLQEFTFFISSSTIKDSGLIRFPDSLGSHWLFVTIWSRYWSNVWASRSRGGEKHGFCGGKTAAGEEEKLNEKMKTYHVIKTNKKSLFCGSNIDFTGESLIDLYFMHMNILFALKQIIYLSTMFVNDTGRKNNRNHVHTPVSFTEVGKKNLKISRYRTFPAWTLKAKLSKMQSEPLR